MRARTTPAQLAGSYGSRTSEQFGGTADDSQGARRDTRFDACGAGGFRGRMAFPVDGDEGTLRGALPSRLQVAREVRQPSCLDRSSPVPVWRTKLLSKNTICLWYNGTALEAAQFYAQTFPDSAVGTVHRALGDYPAGRQGDVLTVEFTVIGIPCLGLNGGPAFTHSEAFSFQVATDDQEETDRLWNAIVGNGGQESACGWCKDKWGLSWQITPRALTAAVADPDRAAAQRAFEAMMQMRKIDIAAIEAARRG